MLYAIVTEFIRNNYLGQVMYNIQKNIDSATKGKYSFCNCNLGLHLLIVHIDI